MTSVQCLLDSSSLVLHVIHNSDCVNNRINFNITFENTINGHNDWSRNVRRAKFDTLYWQFGLVVTRWPQST